MAKSISCPELFRFIHKHIQDFCGVRIHDLHTNNIYFDGANITCEDACLRTEKRQSRNGDKENENCKREASDDNESEEEEAIENKIKR